MYVRINELVTMIDDIIYTNYNKLIDVGVYYII